MCPLYVCLESYTLGDHQGNNDANYTSSYYMEEDFWDKMPVILNEEEKNLIDLRRMGYRLAEMATLTGNKVPYVKRVFYNAIKRIKEANNKSV
jgi:hypothetical protein